MCVCVCVCVHRILKLLKLKYKTIAAVTVHCVAGQERTGRGQDGDGGDATSDLCMHLDVTDIQIQNGSGKVCHWQGAWLMANGMGCGH